MKTNTNNNGFHSHEELMEFLRMVERCAKPRTLKHDASEDAPIPVYFDDTHVYLFTKEEITETINDVYKDQDVRDVVVRHALHKAPKVYYTKTVHGRKTKLALDDYRERPAMLDEQDQDIWLRYHGHVYLGFHNVETAADIVLNAVDGSVDITKAVYEFYHGAAVVLNGKKHVYKNRKAKLAYDFTGHAPKGKVKSSYDRFGILVMNALAGKYVYKQNDCKYNETKKMLAGYIIRDGYTPTNGNDCTLVPSVENEMEYAATLKAYTPKLSAAAAEISNRSTLLEYAALMDIDVPVINVEYHKQNVYDSYEDEYVDEYGQLIHTYVHNSAYYWHKEITQNAQPRYKNNPDDTPYAGSLNEDGTPYEDNSTKFALYHTSAYKFLEGPALATPIEEREDPGYLNRLLNMAVEYAKLPEEAQAACLSSDAWYEEYQDDLQFQADTQNVLNNLQDVLAINEYVELYGEKAVTNIKAYLAEHEASREALYALLNKHN